MSKNQTQSQVILKDTITRLLKDVKQIIKNPLTENGIYYIHDDTDMLRGYALIMGPEDTPYFGGYYFFEFRYPTDYPYSPPKVIGLTNGRDVRFNPNMYKCGKICVSILNTWHGDQWSACQTISTILLTLCTLLCKDPLLNEPGVNKLHRDFGKYTEIIEYANLDIAVCDLLDKKEGVFLKQMIPFQGFMKEAFLKKYERLVAFTEEKLKSETYKTSCLLTTGMYNMKVYVDYVNTLKRLKELKESFTSEEEKQEEETEKIEF